MKTINKLLSEKFRYSKKIFTNTVAVLIYFFCNFPHAQFNLKNSLREGCIDREKNLLIVLVYYQ